MSKVRARGNKSTEVKLRMALISCGIGGFTMDNQDVFGRPDFYWPELNLAVFVDGCFWHGCKKHCRVPKTNTAYWSAKIERNKQRDRKVQRELNKQGIKTLRLWEHDLKENLEKSVEKIIIALFDLQL